MLRQISWSSYFEFICIMLLSYYATVLLIYYRSYVMKILLLKAGLSTPVGRSAMPGNEKITESETLNNLLHQIKISIQKAGKNASPKEEIIFALRNHLASEQLQFADKISFQNHINDFISKTCESICSIHLSEEDLRVLWI